MKYKRIRKPSINKRIAARTKGRATRTIKKAIIPGYGKKGMGILNLKKAIYNKIYNKIIISVEQIFREANKDTNKSNVNNTNSNSITNSQKELTIKEWLDIAIKMNKDKSVKEPWDLPEGFPKMSDEEFEEFDAVISIILVFFIIIFLLFVCWIWF